MSAQPAPPAPEPEPSPARVRLRRLRVAALIGLVATTMVTTLVGGFFTQLGTGAYNRVFTPQTPTTTHPPPGPTPTPAASTTATAGPATSPPVPPPPTRGPSSAPRPSPTRTAGPSPTGAAVRTPTTNLRLYPGRNGDTGQGLDLDLDSAPGAWIGPVGCPDTDFYVNDNATRMTNLYGCWTQTPPAGASFALVATDAPISYDTCAHHDWSVHGMAFATLRVGLRFCVWTGEHRRALVTVTGLNTEPETPDSPHTVNYLDLTITVWEQATEVA